MNKVKFFRANTQIELEEDINRFIENKEILSISYSVTKLGYFVQHYCCVVYEVNNK